MMDVAVERAGTSRHAQLQSDHHQQSTITFYKPDTILVVQPTVAEQNKKVQHQRVSTSSQDTSNCTN